MSTPRAIAAITEKFVACLAEATTTLRPLRITTRPLDKAREFNFTGRQINLFLYQTSIDPAWRNRDLPGPAGAGQPQPPLLPLKLHYLITVYQDRKSQVWDIPLNPPPPDRDRAMVADHELLGFVMSQLHHSVELQKFPSNEGIENQPDALRVTPLSLSVDEISKLWSAFQTPYRISAAYEVCVALIENRELPNLPLPVTQLGEANLGWDATTQFPAAVLAATFQSAHQPGVRLGEQLTLAGQDFRQPGELKVVFKHKTLPNVVHALNPDRHGANEIVVSVPNAPANWPAGFYLVGLKYTTHQASDPRVHYSNSIPVALLPQIDTGTTLTAVSENNGKMSLELSCRPHLQPSQLVQLSIGGLVAGQTKVTGAATQKVKVFWRKADLKLKPGDKGLARLTIDGADSLVYDPAKLQDGFLTKLEVKNI